jgi:hypothetical protein
MSTTVTNTVEINAGQDEVWAVLADLSATRMWLPGVVSTRMDGRIGRGSGRAARSAAAVEVMVPGLGKRRRCLLRRCRDRHFPYTAMATLPLA